MPLRVPRPTCVRVDVPLPMPPELGQRLEASALYSVGKDFTNGHGDLDPNYEGTSHLRHVYQGKKPIVKKRKWGRQHPH